MECRICGLNFLPNLAEDRERHEQEHRRILWGALPCNLREFLKRHGWEGNQVLAEIRRVMAPATDGSAISPGECLGKSARGSWSSLELTSATF